MCRASSCRSGQVLLSATIHISEVRLRWSLRTRIAAPLFRCPLDSSSTSVISSWYSIWFLNRADLCQFFRNEYPSIHNLIQWSFQ